MSLEDPRQRSRTYLLTYLDPSGFPAMGNIYHDDGETPASYAVMYAKPNIPLKLLYYGNKNYDVIFCIGEPDAAIRLDWTHKTYGYTENIPITISAIDKDGATAQLMLWQAELKLRKIAETYFSGNLRTLRRTKPNQQYLGGFFEYTVECLLSYIRSTDTVPSYPTLTYGSGGGAGTFTFPNITNLEIIPTGGNIRKTVFGRLGNVTQKPGLADYQIKITCDLDVEPETKTWMRPQTTSPKNDIIKGQVFWDIYHNGQVNEPYQTLNLGWGATIPVILEEPVFKFQNDAHTVELLFYRLNADEPSTYKASLGISP